MARLTVKKLRVESFLIIDRSDEDHETMPATVSQGSNYYLRVRIQNTDSDDSFWYDNIQVRVIPMETSVQFYTGFSYSTEVPRFDSPLFNLHSTERNYLEIPFRWNGNQPVDIAELKFDTGLYAHELPISSNWKKLVTPIF